MSGLRSCIVSHLRDDFAHQGFGLADWLGFGLILSLSNIANVFNDLRYKIFCLLFHFPVVVLYNYTEASLFDAFSFCRRHCSLGQSNQVIWRRRLISVCAVWSESLMRRRRRRKQKIKVFQCHPHVPGHHRRLFLPLLGGEKMDRWLQPY
ncbi:hypothetical protein BDR26DRAFT_874438 [Obelidium mucronatum]|nr:hypothetical protein BDR26DRAFT_874438 [Obelidium mucronatum]